MVYVHYNLRLLTHYCEQAKSDRSYITWDNNLEENNLEDGALVLECLEDELLGDDDHQTAAKVEMPPPPFPLASQTPFALVRGVMQVLDMVRNHWLLLGMMRLLNLLLLLFIGHGKKIRNISWQENS